MSRLFRLIPLILLMLFVGVVAAQEATATPIAAVDMANAALRPATLVVDFGLVLIAIVSIVLGGGVTLVVVVGRLRNDPAAMAAVERLGDSVPAETANRLIDLGETVREFTRGVNAAVDLMIEAVDRIPHDNKPPRGEG